MMTSAQIRQSFLDFFREKQHTIVPSSSLMPDSPNLLFTNAGMNQFVPIFLGERSADVSKWGGAIAGSDTRAADTQKCIRAGGKHNDLDDVGLDTYHHTFFEMLGNWSFGDYFKTEAVEWAWELVVERWKFPAERLYATIYQPDATLGDPAERDQEAWDFWAEKFRAAGLDPEVHIVNGSKKDNFWMMGETGPCGPCSELHMDLTPLGDTGGHLVNAGSSDCIEIWNLVFIQFNANPDGTFSPLPAQHVDTGMGFERVASIIQGTKSFTDFANAKISNYNTDIFRPIFDEIEKLSGRTYTNTLPKTGSTGDTGQEKIDVSFRVIADHIRTLGFAIAAGIAPGNTDRNYVLRRILRRAVKYGRTLGFREPFFYKLVPVLAREMGEVFPELRTKQKHIEEVLKREEEQFNKTLDKGIALFEAEVARLISGSGRGVPQDAKPGTLEACATRSASIGTSLESSTERSQNDPGSAPFEGAGAGFQPVPSSPATNIKEDAATPAKPQPEDGGRARGVSLEAKPGTLEARATQPTRYTKRNLPHHERAHGIYHVTFTTRQKRILTPPARTIVLNALRHFDQKRYELFAACVMPDHAHVLIQPWIKDNDAEGKGRVLFWSLGELMHSIKSFSANEINALENRLGEPVWEKESHDRLMRSDKDMEEKFHYICRNPWTDHVAGPTEDYEWVWTFNERGALPGSAPFEGAGAGFQPVPSSPATNIKEDAATPAKPQPEDGGTARGVSLEAKPGTLEACATQISQISGAFAFRLYDEQGFPLDLTELMARERGLTVDTAGFEVEMEKQRARARAAQKKTVIELSEVETKDATHFIGYEHDHTGADVLEVLSVKGRTVVIANNSVCYAEMGGQVGDTGTLSRGADSWRIAATQKSGNTWLHFLDESDGPGVGDHVTIELDRDRRAAIQRHHTVTHLLHWALHEVVSPEATQKGSFVGPDKLTFDFNHQPLTPQQVRDVERMVNERIIENTPVSWIEVPYADVRGRDDIMQFFGDKYGETVRVVQIGGAPTALNGYSMELCAGTHTRAAGEIGLFRINSEAAIAAGVRRIDAIAGLNAYAAATADMQRLHALATTAGTPLADLEKRIEGLLSHQKELEKALKSAQQREASGRAKDLLASAGTIAGTPAIIANLGEADGDALQAVADALKSHGFQGVAILGAASAQSVALVASVSSDFTAKLQAGKLIQQIAPIVGGKGGGKPESARGGGKDASKLDEALAHAKTLL